jgi:RF-1 domain
MSTRLLSDDALLAQCRWEQFRGSGPGGQKRNKTSNAVRLKHEPTGVAVTATESRSLAENKLYALRRLKLKLAAELREPVDLLTFAPPDWLLALRHDKRIEVSHRHPLYAAVGGLVLDLLAALGGNPAAVAINLGVSTTAVVKLLEAEPQLWTAANHIRAAAGLPALSHRR